MATPTINATSLTPIVAGAITSDYQVTIYDQSGNAGRAAVEDVVSAAQTINGCLCVQTVKLDIPTAEVLTLNTTPKPFGLTVPAGFAVQPLSWHMRSTFNSVAYATNTNLLLRAVTGPVTNLGAMSSVLAFVNDTFTANGLSVGGVANADCLVDGADLEVLVETGDPTAGDSDITIYLTYVLIEL